MSFGDECGDWEENGKMGIMQYIYMLWNSIVSNLSVSNVYCFEEAFVGSLSVISMRVLSFFFGNCSVSLAGCHIQMQILANKINHHLIVCHVIYKIKLAVSTIFISCTAWCGFEFEIQRLLFGFRFKFIWINPFD